MNDSQQKAIDKNKSDLHGRAETGALIMFFHENNAFDYEKYDELRESRFPTKKSRAVEFFKIVKDIENGWDLLEKGLKGAGQTWLWKQLFEAEKAARTEFEFEKRIQELQVFT